MSLTNTSKFVSLILRHKPETIGIQLDEHGWANVEELIAGISKTREFNREMLEEIVRTDSKQRFTFNEDKTKIRANQGHSIPVDVELPEVVPPDRLWHGTGEKYVASIDQEGADFKEQIICAFINRCSYSYKSRFASWKACALYCENKRNA